MRLPVKAIWSTVVLIVLAAPLHACTSDPKPKTVDKTVADTRVKVTSTIKDGDLSVEPAPAATAPAFARPLSSPVRLNPGKGSLVGDATVSFVVDSAKLPAGMDPADGFVSIYTRESDEQPWRWVGGKYDPAGKTISVTTRHFSDWMYAVTDFSAILDDAKDQEDGQPESLGFAIARSVAGDSPNLSCPKSDSVPAGFAFRGPLAENLKICAVVNRKTKKSTVHIVNHSAIPFTLTIPEGMSVDYTEMLAEDAALDLMTALHLAVNERFAVLGPEGELTLEADAGGLPTGTQVPVKVAFDYAAVDIGFGMIDIVAHESSKLLKGEIGKVSKNKKVQAALKNKGILDCLVTAGEKLQGWLKNKDSLDEFSDLSDTALGCVGDVLSVTFDLLSSAGKPIAEQISGDDDVAENEEGGRWEQVKNAAQHVVAFSKKAAAFGKDTADLVQYLNDTADTLRQYLDVALALTAKAAGADGIGVLLRPKVSVSQPVDALPFDKGADNRDTIPVDRDYGLTCADGIDPANMILSPVDVAPNAIATATATYRPQTVRKPAAWQLRVLLMQVKSGHGEQAKQLVSQLPAECSGTASEDGSAPVSYQAVKPPLPDATAARTYAFTDPDSSLAGTGQGFQMIAVSGKWLIDVTMFYDGEETPARDLFENEAFALGLRLDDMISSNFTGLN